MKNTNIMLKYVERFVLFLFDQEVTRHLVRRYIVMSQQSAEHSSVTEDDINELKQDISAYRCELIDILQQSGFNVNASCNMGKEYAHLMHSKLLCCMVVSHQSYLFFRKARVTVFWAHVNLNTCFICEYDS
jgi:hypothetical protein